MRVVLSILFGVCISIGLFFGMHLMITSDNNIVKDEKKMPHLIYLAQKEEIKMQEKKRAKPKKPPQKEPLKQIKIVKTKITPKITQKVKIKPFHTDIKPKDINISAISSLNDAKVYSPPIVAVQKAAPKVNTAPVSVQQPMIYDAKSLQVLRKVNPKYPRRAKMKKQSGYVKMAFQISKTGDVSDIVIVESKPKGAFEKASIKAIKRWRFKPSNEAKNATITFNFRLAK